MRDTLTERLIELFDKTATDDWPLVRDDPELRQRQAAACPDRQRAVERQRPGDLALGLAIAALAGRAAEVADAATSGRSAPTGSIGRDGERAQFDQQPIEAHATVAACIEAYHATDDPAWLQEARLAFEWFLGGNDLGLDLYDAKTGGCCDGLQEDRVNLNQGAESTLAFLLALGEMKLLESTLATFRQVQVN